LCAVSAGALFDVAIDETGKSYQAWVVAVNSRVDPVSQTIEIESVISKLRRPSTWYEWCSLVQRSTDSS
jgi:hypothetical protein